MWAMMMAAGAASRKGKRPFKKRERMIGFIALFLVSLFVLVWFIFPEMFDFLLV